MAVTQADRRRLCLYLVAPALCDAILPTILEAALDRNEGVSALCVAEREAAIRGRLEQVRGTLRLLASIGSPSAMTALASILVLDDWSEESLDAVARGLGGNGTNRAAEAVRILLIGSYAGVGNTRSLRTASVALKRVVAECVNVEAVIMLGKLERIDLPSSLARCHTLAIVKASWRELDLVIEPFSALRTIHVDALYQDERAHSALSSAAKAVLGGVHRLSLGVGSLDCAGSVLEVCTSLKLRQGIV